MGTLSRRKLTILLIVCSMCVAIVLPVAAGATTQDEEPNDDQATATEITTGTAVTGQIAGDGDEDWFAVDVAVGETFNVTAELGPGAPLKIQLIDPDGDQVAGTRGDNATVSLGGTAVQSGTYYVRVFKWFGDGGSLYSFTAETFDTTDREPNEGPDNATTLSKGETITDVIPERTDEDWYTFDAEAGETINVTAELGTGAGLKFGIVDPDRNRVGGTRGGDETVVGGVTAQQSGTYYLRVHHWTGDGSTDYSFELETYQTSENEPNENRETATQLSLNASVEDTISLGDVDWYAFDLQEGDSIIVEGTASSAGGNNFVIRGPDDNILNGTARGDGQFVLDATAPSTGTHYLTVSQSSSPGADYTLEVRTNGTSATDQTGEGGQSDSGTDGGTDGSGVDEENGDSGGLPMVPIGVGLVVVLLLVVFLWRRDDDEGGQQRPRQ